MLTIKILQYFHRCSVGGPFNWQEFIFSCDSSITWEIWLGPVGRSGYILDVAGWTRCLFSCIISSLLSGTHSLGNKPNTHNAFCSFCWNRGNQSDTSARMSYFFLLIFFSLVSSFYVYLSLPAPSCGARASGVTIRLELCSHVSDIQSNHWVVRLWQCTMKSWVEVGCILS